MCGLLPGLWFLSGCAATPAAKSVMPEQEALVTQPLIRNEQAEHVVKLYQHPTSPASLGQPAVSQIETCIDSVATCEKQQQNQQRLQAIDALIEAGNGTAAKNEADAMNAAELPPDQRVRLRLLYAQILLSFGEAEQSIDSLAQIQPQQLSTDNQIKYFQSLSFAYSLTGNLLASAKSRIEIHPLISSAEELEKNQAAILETLSLLPDSTLQSNSTGTLAGWMALSSILKKINQPDFNALVSQWRTTFSGHPADLSFLDSTQDAASQTKSIALLLPGSGPFVQAGKAIRAGFIAASNHDDSSTKLSFRFYDSEKSTPQAIYNQAVSEGAQLIIGPLAKEQLQGLADTVNFEVPVLALNHIPGLQKKRLYQFSLSPLDDAGQLTQKARADGHQKALLLMPENAAGKRTSGYLTDDWQNQGGTVLETQAYNPKETDFSSPIQKLLNLDESEQRYHKIQALIPAVKYTPRRRQDADTILLSANSAEARSINPQLQFYQAGDLPVYAMPNVYTGQSNEALDADLNKIMFCDTPWLFKKAYEGAFGMDALTETWKQFPSAYFRLIAMGIDAYNLASRLDNLELNPYSGATGTLSLTTDQRIQRQLTCARFKAGQAEVIKAQEITAPMPEQRQKSIDHAVY